MEEKEKQASWECYFAWEKIFLPKQAKKREEEYPKRKKK